MGLLVLILLVTFSQGFRVPEKAVAPPEAPETTQNESRVKYPEDGWTEERVDRVTYRWIDDDIIKSENHFEPIESEKNMKLEGGCELTEAQFQELKAFERKTEYIEKCYCNNGAMYCEMKGQFHQRKLSDLLKEKSEYRFASIRKTLNV